VVERRSVVDDEGRGLRVIAVVNQKGGTGKSTTAANLAVALSAAPLWRKVLVLDLDRQTNVSMMLGHNTSDAPASMSDVFTGRPLRECVLTDVLQPGLSLVVGDPRLADVEFNLGSARRREEVLARQLVGQFDDYDYVLIDCPPNQGLLAVNAVVLASELVVPVRMTDPNSINGLGDLLAFCDELADAGWPRPISAVLRLDVDERRDLYQTFDAALANLDVPVSPVQIPSQAAVAKAAARGRPIVHWRPGSRAGMAYLHFAEQLHVVAAAA
jgi:chromosome partitioning protein